VNCREFDAIRTELARARPLPAALRECALAHATRCPRCGERLAGERQVTAALAALATASRRAAPPKIERALRGAFDHQWRPLAAPSRRLRWPVWAAGAAAAGFVLAGLLTLRPVLRTAPSPAAPVLLDTRREAPAPALAQPPAAPAAARIRPAVRRRPVPPPREPQFFPLPYAAALPPAGEWYLARVRVPRANLAAAGLPLVAGRAAEPVEADIVFAVDGTPRAIRILH